MMILAADIGGTQTRLMLAESDGQRWQSLRREIFPSAGYADFESLLSAFLATGQAPSVAAIAVAGPVVNQRAQMTNLCWTLDAGVIQRRFDLKSVTLLNDFAAQAYALPDLTTSDLVTLHAGNPDAGGVRALMGAGTGLGVSILAGDTRHPLALPSQGGHVDFAPCDEQQLALLNYLRSVVGRVSLETLLCGQGIRRLYGFMTGHPATATDLPEAPAISGMAAKGDEHANATLALFARLLGAAAGNLALTTLATGGVYLSGGIAPRILPWLRHPAVVDAFLNKPPMHDVLAAIPLHVVLDEFLGLRGSARVAMTLCQRD